MPSLLVEHDIAIGMGTVRDVVEDICEQNVIVTEIPLSGVTLQQLEWVIEYLRNHAGENSDTVVTGAEAILRQGNLVKDMALLARICPRVAEPEHAIRLLRFTSAVMYLNIPALQARCCMRVAQGLRGKSEAEIRALYGVPREFTSAERRAAKASPQWVGDSFFSPE